VKKRIITANNVVEIKPKRVSLGADAFDLGLIAECIVRFASRYIYPKGLWRGIRGTT